MKYVYLFADYCGQLTIIDEADIKSHLPIHVANNKKELNVALGHLSKTYPWFYIKTKESLVRYLK